MLLRFKNIPLPDSKRVYVRLRKVGRRLQVLLAPFAELFRLLGRQWPVSLVWPGLSFCCLLPGLAEQQTSEALLEYANAAESAGVLWGRTMITAAISVMLGEVLAHWTARLLDASRHRWFGSEATARRLTAFNRWFPVLALAVAFWTLQDSATGWFYPYRAIAILLAFARPACLAIIYLASLPLRSAAFATAPSVPHWMAARRPYLAALTSAACLVVIFGTADKDHIAGLPVSSVALAQFLGPLNLLLLFFAIFVSIASMLILGGRFLRLPLTALVIFCAIVFSWLDLNDNHSIRTAEETADDKPADVQAAFDRWISQRPDRNRFDGDYPVVLVSAEGGGIRAAFFTAVTLARIVDRCPPLAQHIFAISGVSGGAVGAAVFAAALEAVPPSSTDRKCDLAAPVRPVYENAVSSVLEDDHLSPLLARMLFSDAFQQILPFPVHSFDRQLGLEFSLEQSFRRIFGRDLMVHSLYNLQPSAANTSIPYLLLNSTEVDGGRRFVMTPLYLRTEEFNGVEDWHWLDWKHGPQLSTAAANSARFPIFSPAGYAYNNGRKTRYVDGGYADNSGSVSVMELYEALYLLREQKYLTVGDDGKTTTKFSVTTLHIGNAPACNRSDPKMVCQDIDATPPIAGGFGELLSPIRTVFNVRSAQVEYNLRRLQSSIDRATDLNRFDFHNRIQMYDRGIPVPLGWLLSRRVADELRAQLDPPPAGAACKNSKQGAASNFCELKTFANMMTWAND